jgi:hypothetical protein
VLKTLEGRKLIKAVKSVASKNRKVRVKEDLNTPVGFDNEHTARCTCYDTSL